MKVSSVEIPYQFFAYAGMIFWGLFSSGICNTIEILNFKYNSYEKIDYAISFDVENQVLSDRILTKRSGLLFLSE
jgi:hypothetical protein